MKMRKRSYKIIECIINKPGLKGIKLAKIFKMNCSTMLVIVKRFEELGLIRKEINGRSKNIFITKKGLRIFNLLKIIEKPWEL